MRCGPHSNEIDFFVVDRACLHIFAGIEKIESAVPTHSTVALSLRVAGAEHLTEWVRGKPPQLQRVYGPLLEANGCTQPGRHLRQASWLSSFASEWLDSRLRDRQCCVGVLRDEPGAQAAVDWLWEQ